MDLLYSTGNYIQYFVIIYNGKESENMHMYTHTPMYMCVCVCVCVCVQLNHYAICLKLTQYSKSTILQFKNGFYQIKEKNTENKR